jgi:hypothetical protein
VSTKTRRRAPRITRTRRKIEKDVPTGRDTYVVVDPSGNVLEVPRSRAVFAVVRAQWIAEHEKDPIVLTVARSTILKEPVTLHRIERDRDGVVWTRTLHP